MNISAFNNQGVANSQGSSPDRVNKTDFMHLLTTQLKNQDPFEPVNDAEFLGQLAQFSSLEESQGQTKALNSLAQILTANAGLQSLSQASSLIGKEIAYYDPDLDIESTAKVSSVKFGNGGIQLEIEGGATIPLGNVIEIRETAPGGQSTTALAVAAEEEEESSLSTNNSV